jgi:MFS family permease
MAWGWRVPFLLSVALVAIGIYLRLKVSESPEFQALKETKKVSTKLPLMEVFRKHPRVLLLTIIGGIAPLFIQNMLNSFGINYAINTGGHERSATLWTFTAVTVFHMLAILGSAAFSDRLGRRKVMIIGMILGAVCVWPGFALISSGSAWGLFFGFFLIGPVGQGIMYGPIGAFMAELYSTGSRYTGASLSYQLSSALGGGFAPLISTSLVIAAGGSIVPLNLLVGLVCIVSALAVFGSAAASRRDPWARLQSEATAVAKDYSE